MGADVFQIIDRIEGRALPLRGNDIDTDRIIPARYLKTVRFEGLEQHVFEDDRLALKGGPAPHPFDVPAYQGASILVANRNFGCGSSREHAPQALQRWGIRAILAESFSEIFFGNSLALGMPCLTLEQGDVETLLASIEDDPSRRLVVSISALTVDAGGLLLRAHLPSGAHQALVNGTWDATGLLLAQFEDVQRIADRLPYVQGF
jgi:3-isopropylmalate/(R)-2-methylmalate dehydratase small subunit